MSGKVSDELDTIVMRKLLRILGHQINDITVWSDGEYGPRMQERIEKQQQQVDKIRQWAQQQSEKDVRNAYLNWLDYYYQNGLDDARREMQTKAQKNDYERHQAKQKREREAVLEYQSKREVPEPTI